MQSNRPQIYIESETGPTYSPKYFIVYNVWGFLDVTPGGVTSKNPHTLYTINY